MRWIRETLCNEREIQQLRLDLRRLEKSEFAERRFLQGYNAALADVGLRHEQIDAHAQVELDEVEVDAGIAPLLRALWDLGIETQFSCEGDPDRYIRHQAPASQHDSHIVFAELSAAIRFMERTLGLLGYVPFKDGWLELTPMQPYVPNDSPRGRVGWPPVLLEEITRSWIAHSRRVLAQDGSGVSG